MSAMKKQYDLTQGGILNRLLLVALPIMGTQLLQMAYNLTDMFWLGRMGSDLVAASGTAGMYLWLSNGLLFIGRMGAEIGVSQHLGAGDRKSARLYSQTAFSLSVVLGIAFGALLVFGSTPLIRLLNVQEAHVVADASIYLRIVGAAIPFTFVTGAVAGTFNASGNSRTPFFINAIGLVLNMILDPLLIFTAGWGIVGGAIATAVAQILVCVLAVIAICWKKTRPLGAYRLRDCFRRDREKTGQIFRWSTPIALESMLFTILSMLISRFVARFGADAIAVSRVGSQIESLSWLIGGGFSSAVTAFVGQNYGAGKWGRIHKCARLSSVTMLLWGLAITVTLFFAGGSLFRVFLTEPHLIEMGAVYLRILAFCQLAGTLEGVGAGTLRGIGRTLPSSVASVISNAARVVLIYFLMQTDLGLNGIWVGTTIGAAVRGIWIFLWATAALSFQPREDQEVAG